MLAGLIGATTLPMSMPYLTTVSPGAMSLSATLWPIGMSWRASRAIVRSSSMIQPVIAVPALTPSTTTTATVSLGVVQYAMDQSGLPSRGFD